MEYIESLWPEKGMKVFKTNGGMDNACLNYLSNNWGAYADGFRLAATSITEQLCNTRRMQDVLIFPAIFLFRHYLEIKMKELILLCNSLKKIDPPIYPQTHNLVALYDELIKLLDKDIPELDADTIDSVGKCIKEISSVDRNAESFKYPESKSREVYLKDITHINIRNLDEVIKRMSTFFDSLYYCLRDRGAFIENEEAKLEYKKIKAWIDDYASKQE